MPICPRAISRRRLRPARRRPAQLTDLGHSIGSPRRKVPMEHIGAGLAALGVIGPGIGIGILTGLAAQAIGRNPDAAATIRAQFILGAAFAEGLGVLAIVVAILAIVLK